MNHWDEADSDIADAFGANIDVEGPDPAALGYFIVVRHDDVPHEEFLGRVVGAVGGADRVLLQHPNGVVIVGTSFGVAQWLGAQPMVKTVGGVDVDFEQLQAALGSATPE